MMYCPICREAADFEAAPTARCECGAELTLTYTSEVKVTGIPDLSRMREAIEAIRAISDERLNGEATTHADTMALTKILRWAEYAQGKATRPQTTTTKGPR